MMENSYSKKYFQIYLWQGISLILNFISMFIVVPYLTKDPTIYGIYTVCISVSIFLSYADIGFVGAGQKYAAEFFARNEKKNEIEIVGFTGFILLIFLLILSGVFFYLSFNPELLIKNLSNQNELHTASSLLFILALFAPVTMLQRILQMVFGIRLEDYILQRINILGSILKICSVLWFFRPGAYEISGYFCFVQMANLLALIIGLFIAKRRFDYDFRLLFRSIRFKSAIYSKTRALAFSSLFLTISWILYYELDPLVMVKYVGPKEVAIYGIGLTLLSFLRSILGILFSPFNARFNHFIGLEDEAGLKLFYLHVTTFMAPMVIIPIVTIVILAKPLILTWVGAGYALSIEIAQFLILCNIFAFIVYPTGMLLMAKERIIEMYIVNAIVPFVYWVGIVLTFSIWGIKSFAIFKFIAFVIISTGYLFVVYRLRYITLVEYIKKILFPVLIPTGFAVMSSLLVLDYLPVEKTKINLLFVAGVMGIIISISLVIQLCFSSEMKKYLFKFLSK